MCGWIDLCDFISKTKSLDLMFIYDYLIAIYGLGQPMELWTGKQLFSVLVRPNAKTRVFVNLVVTEKNYNKKADIGSMCPSDGYVCFRNSELISGQLGKATLGRCIMW